MAEQNKYPHSDGRMVTGVFLVIVGAVLLAYKMGAGIPDWIFTWPSILLLVGLYTGIKHRFRNPGWLILIVIGTIFLIDQQVPGLNLHNYTWPIIFIGIGLVFIMRPKFHHRDEIRRQNQYIPEEREAVGTTNLNKGEGEYIEVNSVFGGAKKIVLSKDFRGGEVNCFMGGAEIDLSQADIQGTVMLEVNNVFGGTKLFIPPHWDLKTELTTVFGGIEDKRQVSATKVDVTKVLVLKGATVFGGIDIRSF